MNTTYFGPRKVQIGRTLGCLEVLSKDPQVGCILVPRPIAPGHDRNYSLKDSCVSVGS